MLRSREDYFWVAGLGGGGGSTTPTTSTTTKRRQGESDGPLSFQPRGVKSGTDKTVAGSYLLFVLYEPLVGFFLVEVVQAALSVRQHRVHVRLVLHRQIQRPETQIYTDSTPEVYTCPDIDSAPKALKYMNKHRLNFSRNATHTDLDEALTHTHTHTHNNACPMP